MHYTVFTPGQRLIFIGDSITDAGRRDVAAPYGNGYVNLARAFLLARYPELDLEIINRGISGNTIRDLAQRWEHDVINLKPDWVSIKIGINDVWRKLQGNHREAVPVSEYEATYERLLSATREKTSASLILVEPYVIEADQSDLFRSELNSYLDAVHRLARRHDAILVRAQKAFDEVLAVQPSSYWADDHIHPDAPGHAVIARAWLRAIDYGEV
ncbi:MAG: SGNH/GDSL hydrolase family protein [Candidatus Dormibacteraceae bacterium]